ncbi:MAG: tetratricopeptide repeat protein [Acidobacteriota bacterium]
MRPFSFPVVLALLAGPFSPAPVRAAASQSPQVAPADATAGYYFLVARRLEDDGKTDAAITALKEAITLAPDSAEVRAELAGIYARHDRAREALEMAEIALQHDPANREANRVLGSVYASLVDQRAPVRPGDDPSQYRAKGVAALEKSRRESGVDLNLELMLGRLYLQGGTFDKAIASLKRVAEDAPGYPEGAMLLAAAQEGAGQPNDAIRTLEVSLQENPTFYRGQVRLAELYEAQRRFKDAAAAYGRAQTANARADLAPKQAAAFINAGDPTAARDLLQAAVTRRTTPDAALFYMLAQAQRQLKDFDGATVTAGKLKTAFPDDARALYLYAQILQDKGQTADAITAFQALVKRAPDDGMLLYEYANLLEKGGRTADAERALRDLIGRDPLDANALNSLGYMLAERGQRLDEAVDLVQRALKVFPDNPSFLDSLGWAFYQQGKIEMADAPLTEAAAKLPVNSVVQDHLGELRFKQQRFADAAAAWERALSGDRDAIDSAKIEKRLRDARARAGR